MFSFYLKLSFYTILWSVSVCDTTNESLCSDDNCTDIECGTAATPEAIDIFLKTDSGVNERTDLDIYEKDNESHHRHRTHLLYRCTDENDLLVGNSVRNCHQGKWLGEVPRCAINLMNETDIKSIEIFDGMTKVKSRSFHVNKRYTTFGAFTPPTSAQPRECLRGPTIEQQMWVIHLATPVNVSYIRFKLYAENIQQFWINREIVITVLLNHIRGLALRIQCEFNPHPNDNYGENRGNNNNMFNKNYLSLEYYCELDARHKTLNSTDNKVNKIVINFSYVRKVMNLLSISLCDLRVYYFEKSCGWPDVPLDVQVSRSQQFDRDSGIQQYDFLCNDNEHTLEGKTHIMCVNGKWMDEFPICLPKSYCKPLSFDELDKNLIIEYEDTYPDDFGEIYVANGKMAKFSCRNNTGNRRDFRLNGISRVLCSNGKWQGITQIKPVCQPEVSQLRRGIVRVLLVVLFVCIVLIILLIYLMVRARKAVRRKTIEEIRKHTENTQNNDYRLDYENDYELRLDDNKSQIYGELPHIYYSCDDLDDSSYGLQNNSIYRDDMSDRFLDIDKTNSIYSNL